MTGASSGVVGRPVEGFERVRLEVREPGIYLLTLDRPEKLNAMDATMLAEIPAACVEVSGRADARALIVTGAGRAFSAGADRSMITARKTRDRPWSLPEMVGREADLMARCEVPVIAAIDGPAAGAGMAIALAADFRVMTPDAYFLEAHLSNGLTPTVMCWWLPRMVGFARASDIILSGRKVSAVEALEIGLANEIAPAEGLIERSLELARRVAALPAFTMRMAKRALAVGQDEARMQAVREFGSLANRMGQVDGAAGPASPE